MKKIYSLLVMGVLLGLAIDGRAQSMFWNFDDADAEAPIPSECDGVFDENRGGVYLPTAEEMFTKGEDFLIDSDPDIRRKAGYCLIGAAVQGYVPAQYRVAQLYAKGIVLPQDELSAYRWAFLASMNGNKEAGKLALALERFLTTEDIEIATRTLDSMRPDITSSNRSELDAQNAVVEDKKAELNAINADIDKMLGIKTQVKPQPTMAERQAKKATPSGAIFSDSDRK